MNPWRSLLNLPKDVWVLCATTLINRAGTMVMPFLILYLTKVLSMPAEQAGLVITFYGIGALISAPLAGKLCDRVGASRLMKLSLILTGIVLLLLPLAKSFFTVVLVAVFWSIIAEAYRPANLTVISGMVPAQNRKAAFALHRLAVNLGMSIGPVLGGFLAMFSFHWLFIVDGLTTLMAGVVLIFANLKLDVNVEAQDQHPTSIQSVPDSAWKDWRFLYFLLALLPTLMVFFQHQAAQPLYLVRELHIKESDLGLLFAVNTFLIITIEVPLNLAMSRWSNRASMVLGTFLCGLGFGAILLVHSFLGVAITVAIWTFSEMILFPSTSAFVADTAPATRRGEYMGLYQMCFSLAFTIGPGLGTLVMERLGSTVLWSATFIFGLISAILMMKVSSQPELPLTKVTAFSSHD